MFKSVTSKICSWMASMLLKLKLAGPNPTKQARKSVLTLRNNVFLSVVFNFFRRNNSVLHNALLKAEWVDGMSWYPNHQDSYNATIAHWFPGIQQLNVYLFDPLRHISLQNAGWGLWFPFPQVTSVFPSTKSNLAKSKPRFTGVLYSMDLFGKDPSSDRMGMATFTQELYWAHICHSCFYGISY